VPHTCARWWERGGGRAGWRGRKQFRSAFFNQTLSLHPSPPPSPPPPPFKKQLPGKRGWWSAPLAVRAVHLGVGASAGARTVAALLTLDAAALARLTRPGGALAASPGASLSVSCPCAGGAASRDDSFEFGLADADYRVPGGRGLMVDYSLGVSVLSRAGPAARAAMLGAEGGSGRSGRASPSPTSAAILSGGGGAVPTPAALRPLCRALNDAARLADRPAAPWPGV